MESDYGEFQVSAASILVEEHIRVCVPEPVCHRCLKPWPCADVVWAHEILLGEGPASR